VTTNSGMTLLLGGTGYVGSLIAGALLADGSARLVVPIRRHHDPAAILSRFKDEARARGGSADFDEQAVTIVPYDTLDNLGELLSGYRGQIGDLVNAAGSVDYFDADLLQAANIRMTEQLLELARTLTAQRFVFISTAFCSGYVDGVIAERIHPEPPADPTHYTFSKREAERIVADSGLPFLVLRPSVIIGDSRTGRYKGPRYGLYQFLSGLERLLCRKYHPELHVVAPQNTVHFLHQDAFQNAFLAACRHCEPGSFVNIVAPADKGPDLRTLWEGWMKMCFMPERLFYYQRIDDVPIQGIEPRQRAFISFSSVNTEIATHTWRFDTTSLDRLKARHGLEFPATTVVSANECQRAFIEGSNLCRRLRQEHAAGMPDAPLEVIEVDGTSGGDRGTMSDAVARELLNSR